VATKKEKRVAALAKREAFLEEYRRQGLEAQQNGRISNNLSELVGLLEGALGRTPNEDEIMNFINANNEDRLSFINGR
jgi:hypothetical protein